jgi:hypothetical protein
MNFSKPEPFVLAANVYDTAHFAALANGGVGAGRDCEENYNRPCCMRGLLIASGVMHEDDIMARTVGLNVCRNDEVVSAYLKTHPNKTKMPWDEYVKAYPIVRGK